MNTIACRLNLFQQMEPIHTKFCYIIVGAYLNKIHTSDEIHCRIWHSDNQGAQGLDK